MAADPVPRQLDYTPLPPAAPPLIAADVCSQEFRDTLEALARHERINAVHRRLFRGNSGEICRTALDTLSTELASQAQCSEPTDAMRAGAATMNDCLVAAVANPRIGEARVQGALGRGFLPHVDTCDRTHLSAYASLRDALRETGTLQTLLWLVPPAERSSCERSFERLDDRSRTGCVAATSLGYEIDRCLLLAARDPAGAELVEALTGRGAFAVSLTTPLPSDDKRSGGAARSCGALFDRLAKPAKKKGGATSTTPPLVPADGAPPAESPEHQVHDQETTTEDVFVLLGKTRPLQSVCKDTADAYAVLGACDGRDREVDARVLDVCSAAANRTEAPVWEFLWTAVGSFEYQYFDRQGPTTPRLDVALDVDGNTLTAPPISFGTGTVLTGLADFVATRARKEVLDFLAQEFGGRICAAEIDGVEVSSYFAETCHLLAADGSQSESIAQFGSAVQRALERDLIALVPALLNSAVKSSARLPAWATALGAAATDLARGGDPVAAISSFFAAVKCDPGGPDDFACALHAAGIAWTAVTAGEQDVAIVAEKLTNDASIATWARERRIDVARARTIVELIVILHAATGQQPGIGAAGKLVDAVGSLFEAVTPETEHERIARLISRARGVVEQWGELAYLVFHVADAMIRGESLSRAAIAASARVPCHATTQADAPVADLGCGLRLFGYVLDILTTTRVDWGNLPAGEIDLANEAVRRYVTDVQERLALQLERAENTTLRAWVVLRFGDVVGVPIAGGGRSDIRVLIVRMLAPLREAERLVTAARDDKTLDPAPLMAQAVNVLRAGLQSTLRDDARRARALRVVDDMLVAIKAVHQREIPALATSLYALAVDLGVPDPLPRPVAKYVPLVTALAGAEDAEQVSQAFEKYAEPPGGYRRKRDPGRHVSVTALLGFGAGLEVGEDVAASPTGALVTPVGVDLTWGGCRGCGLHLSVIDIGALTTSRFAGDDDALGADDPTWASVFSPGLYGRLAVSGPFVLAAGATLAPDLRVDDDGDPQAVARFLVALTVDVTILSLR